MRLPGWLALAASFALVACGGGGGGGGGSTNVAPTASFTAAPTSGAAPLTVAVNAAASSDPDGTIASYAWNFGDDSTATGVSTSHNYTTVGSYTITLTVTDNGGRTATATTSIGVLENRAPTASFTTTPTMGTVPFVASVDASASTDVDGSITAYAWDFGDNSSGAGVSTSHTYTLGGNHTIKLTVTDNGGKQATYSQAVVANLSPPSPSVTIGGDIKYERVPFYPSGGALGGLNYGATTAVPARGIVVELRKADQNQSFLATTTTDQNGSYFFAAPLNTNVFVRARAQVLSLGSPGQPAVWNVSVKDNANSSALYAMDGSSFNTGSIDQTRPTMLADSGWPEFGGSTYSGTRVAAPFAVLDSLYSAVQFVATQGDPSITLPPLEVFWSPVNKSSDTWDPAVGNIITTLFQPQGDATWPSGIYVLGNDGVDTDEYDAHVLTHEFNHYLQDHVSRDDTPGGSHSGSDKVDMRVSFSEGFGNAFSGMPLNDPLYRDSYGDKQGNDFGFDLETNNVSPKGWYGESSIGSIVWDLFDSGAEAGDTVTVGYSSILSVFRNQLRTGQPLTSIFPFIVALKAQPGAPVAAIDTLVAAQNIKSSGMDAFGSTETNDGGNVDNPDVLPIYTNISLNGGPAVLCGNHVEGVINKLGNRRFLKFSLNAARTVTITAKYTNTGSADPSATLPRPDPDIVLFKGPVLDSAESDNIDQESMTRALGLGDYVIEVYEYSHIDPTVTPVPTRRGRTCLSVTVTG